MAISVAIVDYGMGNQASVIYALRAIGCRAKATSSLDELDAAQVLLLPGVGAFPAAMRALETKGLVDFLRKQAARDKPILGICLGMQLLTEASYEQGYTGGLGLIPGECIPFPEDAWHIGWNTIECRREEPLVSQSNAQTFYFNHSYQYQGAPHFQVARADFLHSCAAIIRNGNVIGVQFHPEKSQTVGRALLHDIISGLAHA